MSFTWQGRRLATASVNGDSISFKYNSDGIRTQKTVDGVTTYFTLDGSKIISQKTGDQEIFFEYDATGNIATMIYDGDTYYYVRNLMGEIIGLVDDEGILVARYYYDPWGELTGYDNFTSQNIAFVNPFMYKGYYYDWELGFYYLNSRYYDPEICRFINADSVDISTVTPMSLTDKNLFAYCDNNPIMRADDGGEFWHVVAGAAIGGLFELGSQLLSGEEVNWAKVGVATLAGGVTAAVGPLAGAAISGAANIALDMMSGERDFKKLAVSGAIGAGASLVGSGVGKVVEKVGGKVATKALSKMSKAKLKTTVTRLEPAIKGVERNLIKNMSYLTSNYRDIGTKYFMSTHIGRTLTTSIGQVAEGFTGIVVNHIMGRCFPSW